MLAEVSGFESYRHSVDVPGADGPFNGPISDPLPVDESTVYFFAE